MLFAKTKGLLNLFATSSLLHCVAWTIGLTAAAGLLSVSSDFLGLGPRLVFLGKLFQRPLLFFGSIITYFVITGVDISRSDFYKYIFPISVIVNVVLVVFVRQLVRLVFIASRK